MKKIPKNIQCVIFDMDGVIIDSEAIHKKAYYETFVSLGLEVSEKLYKTLTGSSTINAFQRLIAHFNLDLDANTLVLDKRKRYVNFFENDPNLHLVAGVEEIIKYFYEKNCTLILASSSAMININRVFDRFKLHSYFSAKISGADLTASKPHPEIFLTAAEKIGVNPSDCLAFEDTLSGILSAKAAGMDVIGVTTIFDEKTLMKMGCKRTINNYKEIKL